MVTSRFVAIALFLMATACGRVEVSSTDNMATRGSLQNPDPTFGPLVASQVYYGTSFNPYPHRVFSSSLAKLPFGSETAPVVSAQSKLAIFVFTYKGTLQAGEKRCWDLQDPDRLATLIVGTPAHGTSSQTTYDLATAATVALDHLCVDAEHSEIWLAFEIGDGYDIGQLQNVEIVYNVGSFKVGALVSSMSDTCYASADTCQYGRIAQ
jgi:hypothetical protein